MVQMAIRLEFVGFAEAVKQFEFGMEFALEEQAEFGVEELFGLEGQFELEGQVEKQLEVEGCLVLEDQGQLLALLKFDWD